MNDDQITSLAREYAEEEAKGTAVDALPNGFKENVIQRNADHFEKHLRWLLRRFYLVEKNKNKEVWSIKNLPQRIYLNIGDGVPEDADFHDLSEITWSEERINDSDIEYLIAKDVEK